MTYAGYGIIFKSNIKFKKKIFFLKFNIVFKYGKQKLPYTISLKKPKRKLWGTTWKMYIKKKKNYYS